MPILVSDKSISFHYIVAVLSGKAQREPDLLAL
jgi:hypothetical protein